MTWLGQILLALGNSPIRSLDVRRCMFAPLPPPHALSGRRRRLIKPSIEAVLWRELRAPRTRSTEINELSPAIQRLSLGAFRQDIVGGNVRALDNVAELPAPPAHPYSVCEVQAVATSFDRPVLSIASPRRVECDSPAPGLQRHFFDVQPVAIFKQQQSELIEMQMGSCEILPLVAESATSAGELTDLAAEATRRVSFDRMKPAVHELYVQAPWMDSFAKRARVFHPNWWRDVLSKLLSTIISLLRKIWIF
jgi:hypothetical protein